MSNVWRFTGPPENWITAISIQKWALNENNVGLWERSISPGDVVLFHSTKKSGYTSKGVSSIIGYGLIGELYEKDKLWWVQEIAREEVIWPYVVSLKEIYMFSDCSLIDLTTPIHQKDSERVAAEIAVLVSDAVPTSELVEHAQSVNPEAPAFPYNGSASRVAPIYEELILEEPRDLFRIDAVQLTEQLDGKINDQIDFGLSKISREELMAAARAFKDDGPSHVSGKGQRRVRRENREQKRRIAAIENYTCQICGFRYEFTDSSGTQRWICDVDHIIEKSDGGTEDIQNLLVLCPNCHAKKTRGAILVDSQTLRFYENGEERELIRDHHLASGLGDEPSLVRE